MSGHSTLRPLVHRGLQALLAILVLAAPLSAVAASAASRGVWSLPAGDRLLVAAALQPTQTSDEFVPVDELPAQESLPAAPLLVTAYMFVWVVVLVFLLSIWRRLARVEREMSAVARRIEESRRR